jgi:hypothetical protein
MIVAAAGQMGKRGEAVVMSTSARLEEAPCERYRGSHPAKPSRPTPRNPDFPVPEAKIGKPTVRVFSVIGSLKK